MTWTDRDLREVEGSNEIRGWQPWTLARELRLLRRAARRLARAVLAPTMVVDRRRDLARRVLARTEAHRRGGGER